MSRALVTVDASELIGDQVGVGQHAIARNIEFNKAPVGSSGRAHHQIRALAVGLAHTMKVDGL
jgi:hypothetical protein